MGLVNETCWRLVVWMINLLLDDGKAENDRNIFCAPLAFGSVIVFVVLRDKSTAAVSHAKDNLFQRGAGQ